MEEESVGTPALVTSRNLSESNARRSALINLGHRWTGCSRHYIRPTFPDTGKRQEAGSLVRTTAPCPSLIGTRLQFSLVWKKRFACTSDSSPR